MKNSMTKPLKPGQLCTVGKKLYRAKKEIDPGTCMGCDLKNSIVDCSRVECGDYHVIVQQEVKTKKEKLHA